MTAPSRSERVARCFSDMLAAIHLIRSWIESAEDPAQLLAHDSKTRSAVERQLLVISEAAIRLHRIDPSMSEQIAPEIDWPGVRGIGNFIRHKYDDLDTRIIVDAIVHRFAALESACQRALAAAKDHS